MQNTKLIKIYFTIHLNACILFFYLCAMDEFQKVAETIAIYKIRTAWHEISRLYNEISADYGGTMSMGFILLTLDDIDGTPVTKIAPRMGMKPNSLSRVLKSMEKKELIFRKRDKTDHRKVYICLTDLGKEMRKVSFQAVFKLEETIVKDLPQEKLTAFFEVMNHVSKAVEQVRMQEEVSETVA